MPDAHDMPDSHNMPRTSRCAASLALTIAFALTPIGCEKAGAATQPELVAADGGGEAAAGEGGVSNPSEAADEAGDEAPAIVVPVTADPADPADPTDPADPADTGPAEGGELSPQSETGGTQAAGDPAKVEHAKLELPAPMFPKIREGCGGAPGVGQRVKSFKLKTPEGKTIAPSYYKGRVVLLNFWGTWCKPCLKELPEFSRLYRRYRKYGLTLVAVATDDDAQAVQTLIKEKKISAKVAIGGEATASAYGDRNFPFTFVVDAKGVIRAAYDGYKEGCLGAVERDIRTQLEARNK